MSNFSVNQVRQLYVANNGYSATPGNNEGIISKVAKTPEDELFFIFQGAKVGNEFSTVRSDLIKIANISKIEKFDATQLIIPMSKVKVVLNSTINSGNPVAGQDYILGIQFKNFFSAGDDSTYYKDAAVHVTSAMEADKKEFYKAMVAALNMAFSREDGATANSNPYLSFSAGTPASEDGIYIEEKPQEWARGTKKARRIMFEVFPSLIYTGGDDVIWAGQDATTGKYYTDLTPKRQSDGTWSPTATVGTNAVGDGQGIADLEWFCMGERGDQYRNLGWPNVIPTKYLADSAAQYDVLEIHYAFTDSGVNSYRTEKELTIVAPYTASGADVEAKHAIMNTVIGAINSAAGTTLIAAWSNG